MKNVKVIFSNYLNWGKRFLTQKFNGSVIYNQRLYFYYYYFCLRLDTVQEVLRQVKAKAESLGLESTDLVFDHAIYAKAVEVLTNPANKDLQSFINLLMDPFHAFCIYLAVLGKRFVSAGLREIIVEADLIGPGSVEAVLRRKNYNWALHVYEALMRLWKLYDEQEVQDCYNLFANCNNPYQFSEELVSINSGVAVAAEIKGDLLKANEVGKKCLKNFIDKRIKKNE